MHKQKFYKLHIYSVSLNTQSKNQSLQTSSNIELQITLKQQFKITKLKQISVQQAINLKLGLTIEQSQNENQEKFIIACSFIDKNMEKIFAYGEIIVDAKSVNNKGSIDYMCMVKDEELDYAGNVKIAVGIDQQKVFWGNLSEPQQSQNSDTEQYPNINKKQSFFHPSLHKTRKHHFFYLINSQQPQINVNNKIINQSSILITNISFKQQQLPTSIKFINKQNNQLIAQITIRKNAKIQKLKKIIIKLPSQINNVSIQVININGQLIKGSIQFDILQKEKYEQQKQRNQQKKQQYKNKNIILRDKNNNKISIMQINYKYLKQYDNINININQSKLYLTKNINNQYNRSPISISKFLQNSDQKSINFNNNIYLNKLLISLNKKPKLRFTKNINQIILPTPKPKNTFATQVYQMKQTYLEQDYPPKIKSLSHIQKIKIKTPNKKYQTIDIQSSNRSRISKQRQRQRNNNNGQWRIRISSVLVQLHSSFMIKYNINVDRDSNIGKFLQIYSTAAHIHRSQVIYASQSLSWKLSNCELFLNQNQNIAIEVCLAVEKSSIGQSIISLQKLRNCLQKNTYFKGNLLYNRQIIGTIIMNFRLKQLDYTLKRQRKSTTELSHMNQRLRLGLPYLKGSSANKKQESAYKIIRLSTLQQIPQKSKKKKTYIISPKNFQY